MRRVFLIIKQDGLLVEVVNPSLGQNSYSKLFSILKGERRTVLHFRRPSPDEEARREAGIYI